MSLRCLQNAGDRGNLAAPLGGLGFELLPAALREGVELGAAVVLSRTPLRLDPAGALQAPEGREQRTRIHAKNSIAGLFDPHRDSIAVKGFERQRLKYEHVERALDQIGHNCLSSRQSRYKPEYLDCQEERLRGAPSKC